ncbi:ABC transporter permease [Qaidamihabitans albus]|uniref:ABC transporter permease n=1 Tax=Qaidamihabitans albus TaxID=2795733 RepID=UPI0018F1C6FB|nr:ABC transporter permease [Qaidamihabitans albus]
MTGNVVSAVATPDLKGDLSGAVERLRRDRAHERRKRRAWAIFTPLALLLGWELASRFGLLDERFFPSPLNIVSDALRYFAEPDLRADLLVHLAQSGTRLGLGFLLGAVAGLLVGLAIGLHPVTRYALSAVINGIYPLPKLTLYPLMIIFFGIGNTSMIALIALGVFFMVAINTASGVMYSDPVYKDVASAFELPRLVRLRTITVPAAIPSVISGLRLGFGQALIIVVATEFVAGDGGVGYLIWNSWQILDVPVMFLGLTIVGLTGWLASACISWLGKILAPWQAD